MKKFLFRIKYTSTKAFTLIEALASLTIITMAILGPLSVAINSASYAKNTKDAITATYLAHEGIELVRFKRDSTYVECQNNATTCVLNLLTSGNIESVPQGAWRIFKERFGVNDGLVSSPLGLQPSCFSNQNTAGCSFDIDGIVSTGSDVAERMRGDTDECSSLYTDNRLNQPTGTYVSTGFGVTNHMYICKNKVLAYDYINSGYKRVVTLTSTYSNYAGAQLDPYLRDYEDDVRVDSVVTYSRSMGLIRTVKAVDYLHARP